MSTEGHKIYLIKIVLPASNELYVDYNGTSYIAIGEVSKKAVLEKAIEDAKKLIPYAEQIEKETGWKCIGVEVIELNSNIDNFIEEVKTGKLEWWPSSGEYISVHSD